MNNENEITTAPEGQFIADIKNIASEARCQAMLAQLERTTFLLYNK